MSTSTMNRVDRRLWRSARTLADLGGLMARWLEGGIRTQPGYYGRTDLDTPELTTLCARLCRAGVVTHQSQAAQSWPDGGRITQARLFIEAFADDSTVAQLHAACSGTDLRLIANRTPGRAWFRRGDRDRIPVVTTYDGGVRLSLTSPIPRRYVDLMWEGIHRDAHAAVLDAWQVAIVDPEWGRNELTHDVLTRGFLEATA